MYMEFHWFDSITICMIVLFIYGILYNEPSIFIQINFIIKVLISLYLIYHFNDFRNTPVKFTTLDKKICYSAGIYIFIFSFADLFNSYLVELHAIVTNKILNVFN
jgi:hypothetical protein